MDRKKDIIKIIDSMAGRYSAYEVFTDWTKCSALAISNSLAMIHDKVWQKREDEYRATIQKYSDKEREQLVEMFDLLVETLEGTMADVLGQIYMESGMGSKAAGQFFTPYHLSQACANLTLLEPDEHGIYRVSEPSCGGGGMIIAIAERMRDQGIDYDIKLYLATKEVRDHVSKIYQKNMLRVISSFYQWMVKEEYLLKNPMNKVDEIKTPKVKKSSIYGGGD